jgi:DNA repair photolyase
MISEKLKGRGAQSNPKNRFDRLHIEELEEDKEFIDDSVDNLRKVNTVFYRDYSKSVISKNDSYDLDFNYSFNPYRGCEHGCVYCYARPTHEYLGFSSGIDFETKIIVKEDAANLLEHEFKKKSYKPETIMFSGNTDCYQPIEKKLRLTRRALQICLDYRNPVSIVTKNSLIERDIDILKKLASMNLVTVLMSITTLDKKITVSMEPRTSTPEKRLKTIEILSKNNIPSGVNLAPIIPGLNDEEIPIILKEVSKHGGILARHSMIRLPYSVKEIFIEWIKNEFPDRSSKILNKIREIHGGKLNENEFGKRFRGEGKLADTINNLFNLSCKRLHLNEKSTELNVNLFRKAHNKQLEIF